MSVTVTAPRATFVEAISGLSSLRFLAVELYSSSVYAIYDTVHHEPVLLNGAFPALEDLTLRTSTPAACLAYFGCPPNLRRIRLEIVHPHATEPIEPFGQAVRTMAPSDLELCFRGASLRRDEENALISSCLGANLGLEGIHIHRHACDGLKVPELSKMPRLCRLTLSWTPADLRDALSALDKLAFLELPADGDAVAALSHVVPPEGVTVEVVANAMDQHLRHLLCLGFAARRASRREGTVRLVIVAPGGRPMDDMPKLTMGESFGEAGAAQP